MARGVGVHHLHGSTLKPFDREGLIEAALGKKGIITLENHTIIGGLGSLVAEILAEEGLGIRLKRLGLKDIRGNRCGQDTVQAWLYGCQSLIFSTFPPSF